MNTQGNYYISFLSTTYGLVQLIILLVLVFLSGIQDNTTLGSVVFVLNIAILLLPMGLVVFTTAKENAAQGINGQGLAGSFFNAQTALKQRRDAIKSEEPTYRVSLILLLSLLPYPLTSLFYYFFPLFDFSIVLTFLIFFIISLYITIHFRSKLKDEKQIKEEEKLYSTNKVSAEAIEKIFTYYDSITFYEMAKLLNISSTERIITWLNSNNFDGLTIGDEGIKIDKDRALSNISIIENNFIKTFL